MTSAFRQFIFFAFVVSLLLLSGVSVLAQGGGANNHASVAIRGPIEVQVSVDKGEAYIGDLITYTIAITYDSAVTLIPPPVGANLGGFDVKDYSFGKEETLEDGRKRIASIFKLATFTIGEYIIPPMPVGFTDRAGATHQLSSDVVPIKIVSLLEGNADTLEVRPLKDPIDLSHSLWWLYGAIAASVILAGFLIWYYKFRRRAKGDLWRDTRPAWEQAYEKLAALQYSDFLAQSQFKEYYSGLTEIMREYLGRIYNVGLLEMTTEETLDTLRGQSTPEQLVRRIGEALAQADLVKFARVSPPLERVARDFDTSYELIGAFKEITIERERQEAIRVAELARIAKERSGRNVQAEGPKNSSSPAIAQAIVMTPERAGGTTDGDSYLPGAAHGAVGYTRPSAVAPTIPPEDRDV